MTLKRKIIYGGLWGDIPIGVDVPKRETAIRACARAQAAQIIRANHYSRKTAATPSYINLLVYYRGTVSGALMLGYGIGLNSHILERDSSVEFDRMWLSDDMPKYSETVVLGALHTYIRAAYPKIRQIRTFADTGVGNDGTIYRAANYKFERSVPAGFYILPDKTRIHRVALWRRYGPKGNHIEWLQQKFPGIIRDDSLQNLFTYDLY